MIRIANGQGFWGDWLEAPVRLVDQGPIDYLVLDYLAEVTLSILQKQRQRDPALGYARDFPPLMARLSKRLLNRGVKVVANAGGVNPIECARMVRKLAPDLRVAVVLGDDVLARLAEFRDKGYALDDLDTGTPFASMAGRVLSANAYIGAFPLAEALHSGADVVVAGRATDVALAMAPMIQRFGWREEEWDKLAAGAVAGHLLECGPQSTGGNSQVDWMNLPDLDEVGYPIVEAEPDGCFTLTKHPGTGGRVNSHVVKEQLLYEIFDPARYMTADCVADFTTIHLRDAGPDRVRISGVRGAPAPPDLKLSISYSNGWKCVGTLVYTRPQALEKAHAADAIVRRRIERLGLGFDEIHTEFFGAGACLGITEPDPPEVQLRIGVRGQNKDHVERFTREMIPLVLSGPPGATGYGEGRPAVREVVAYWSCLVPREEIRTHVEVLE